MQKAFSFKNLLRHVFAVVTLTSLFLVSTGCSSQAAQTEPVKETKPAAAAMADKSGKTLVVYFSATGHTKKVAETIAKQTGADLFEIKPEQPYTLNDLNYNDKNSRVQKEHNNPSLRPDYVGDAKDWAKYDRVFIGFPHWWRQAPHVVYTFVEKHDFTGKTVIPFATSMSTPMGDSGTNLEKAAGTGKWLEGHRFEGNVLSQDVISWVKSLK